MHTLGTALSVGSRASLEAQATRCPRLVAHPRLTLRVVTAHPSRISRGYRHMDGLLFLR